MLALGVSLSAVSCVNPAPQTGTRRIAILPFENLTGDSSLDWVRAAGAAIVEEELASSTRALAIPAASVIDARLENTPEVLHAYYTKEHGAVRITAEIEDRRTRRIDPIASSAGTVLAQSEALAHKLDPQARAYSTSNEAAVEALGEGDYGKATRLDPDFGAAWIARVRALAQSGKTDEASTLADEALQRKTLRTDSSRDELRALAATLHKDFSARAQALTDLANSAPADASALANAATAQLLARNFAAAADLYRKLRALNPQSPAVLNSLGYAEGFAGNIDAAEKVMADYAKLPNSELNSHDSMGEIYFMNGRFREAEQQFTKAFSLNPNFLNGAPAIKAAYAHWFGGDLAGADAMMQKIVTPLIKSNAPLALWVQASWLYTTGHRDQAVAMLMRAAADGHADPRIQRQLALWQNVSRLPTDPEKLRTAYFATPPGQDSVERVLYGAALVAAGKDSDAKAILARWPVPEATRQPEFDSVIVPKYLELRKKLELK